MLSFLGLSSKLTCDRVLFSLNDAKIRPGRRLSKTARRNELKPRHYKKCAVAICPAAGHSLK